jgi:hypothetical protein
MGVKNQNLIQEEIKSDLILIALATIQFSIFSLLLAVASVVM